MKKIGLFKRKIGIVLMGGGARGLAHIGVLEALINSGINFDLICGTSMGGIIGGLFALGYTPEEIKNMALNFDYSKILKLPRFSFIKNLNNIFEIIFLSTYGRLFEKEGEDKIEELLKEITKEEQIENLKIKFFCTAVDLLTGKEIIFDKGPLYKALRATMSYPFIFKPVSYNKMLLVDGGVLDNAPVIKAKEFGAKKILVVDIHRGLKKESIKNLNSDLSILKRIYDVMTEKLVEINLEKADYVLKIDIEKSTFDFTNTQEIIEKGKEKTLSEIKKIKKILFSF
ncbi:MAG: patatin-like phospholipase family protein [Caldisericia bacterium]|nr:patatin-like phospholipase family protein [Caldisericia bacterium]